MREGYICFNCKKFDPKEIISVISFLKTMASVPIKNLEQDYKKFHFHPIDFVTHPIGRLRDIYSKDINFTGDKKQLPVLYSIEVYTTHKKGVDKAPRIAFYIGSDGIAKVVYFDFFHLLNSTLYKKPKEVPDGWFEKYMIT